MRLSTVDDLAVRVLAPIIASLREAHPRVTVVVDVGSTFVDLGKREADVALRFGGRPVGGDVVAFQSLSFAVRISAICAGVGIGFVPLFVAAQERSLVRLELPFPETPRGAELLLVRADMRKNARVRAFVEHTSGAIIAKRALFERGEAPPRAR